MMTIALWLLTWAGIFTGLYNVNSPYFFRDPLAFFQGARAFLPLLAAYICLLWILAVRSRFPFMKTPLRYLISYGLIGLLSSLLLSPERLTALYWWGAFMSPLFVMWFVSERADVLDMMRRILRSNAIIIIFLLVILLPEAYRFGFSAASRFQFYLLPFGLGEVRANGAGRYALLVLIIAFVELVTTMGKKRILWMTLIIPSLFLLMQTQSRSSLLGLAIVSMLYVLIKGINLRFLLVGPVASGVIWLSGIQWRAQGEIGSLMFLTGRDYTWKRGLSQIKESPFFGWGFHADRILLDSEHMHNSYLHAGIHSGVLGSILFAATIVSLWALIIRGGLLKRIRHVQGHDQNFLMQSVLICGFLTARSFFESTAAFYGVDLLLLVPAICYLNFWLKANPEVAAPEIEPTPSFYGARGRAQGRVEV